MIYKMTLQDSSGKYSEYFYDIYKNTITDNSGNLLIEKKGTHNHSDAVPVSPTSPGKKAKIHTLKIQLGLKCNYSCSYCLQTSELPDANVTSNADTSNFLENLLQWLDVPPKRIEFWGGEPFVYWSKLKILIPDLRKRYPKAEFLIITNGSLLDDEKIQFIDEYDILLGISHDGPQQKYRGPDPFRDEKLLNTLKKLFTLRRGKVSFNSVIHSKNYDLNAIYDWFHERFPNPNLTLEGIITIYDDYNLKNMGSFTKKQYQELVDNIFYEMVAKGSRYLSLRMKMDSFIHSLEHHLPISTLNQRCGMDREDMIAVDLQGNVMTCQNTGSKGKHKIGSVYDYENIKLDTALHLSYREECMHCPVVHLCMGSCMYLEGDYFTQSCWNDYYYNMGIFKAALFKLTGKVLVHIEGDIRRPEYSQTVLDKNPYLSELYV
jgi:uncharacterized protein